MWKCNGKFVSLFWFRYNDHVFPYVLSSRSHYYLLLLSWQRIQNGVYDWLSLNTCHCWLASLEWSSLMRNWIYFAWLGSLIMVSCHAVLVSVLVMCHTLFLCMEGFFFSLQCHRLKACHHAANNMSSITLLRKLIILLLLLYLNVVRTRVHMEINKILIYTAYIINSFLYYWYITCTPYSTCILFVSCNISPILFSLLTANYHCHYSYLQPDNTKCLKIIPSLIWWRET